MATRVWTRLTPSGMTPMSEQGDRVPSADQVAFRTGVSEDAPQHPAAHRREPRVGPHAAAHARGPHDARHPLRGHRGRGRGRRVRRTRAAEPRRRRGALAGRRCQPPWARAGLVAHRAALSSVRARRGSRPCARSRTSPATSCDSGSPSRRTCGSPRRSPWTASAAPSSASADRSRWRCNSTAASSNARARATPGCPCLPGTRLDAQPEQAAGPTIRAIPEIEQ